MKKKLAIFDLDGTLIDSLAEIKHIFNSVMIDYGMVPKGTTFYKKHIGNGIEDLLGKCLPLDHSFDFDKILLDIRKSYKNNVNKYTTVFDGIYKVLDRLIQRKITVAVITNKPHVFALDCINFHFKDYNIDVIGAGEFYKRKPNPESSLYLLKKYNVISDETIFIGDSIIDIQTAKNAKIKSVGVLWGLGSKNQLKKEKSDYIIKKPMDLFDIKVFD